MNDNNYSIDLKAVVMLLLRHFWIILLCFLLSFIVTYFAVEMPRVPQYSAGATMYVANRVDSNNQQYTTSNQSGSLALINTCGVLIKTDTAINKIIAELDSVDGVNDGVYVSPVSGTEYTPEDIRKLITLSSVDSTEVMKINVTCESEYDAITIANATVDVVPEFIENIVQSGYARKVDEATGAKKGNLPELTIPAIAAIAVAVLACGVIILINMLDTRIHTPGDVAAICSVPVIGEIPNLMSKNTERGYYAKYGKYGYYKKHEKA